ICLSVSVWPKLGIVGEKPFSTYAVGSAIDSRMKSSSEPWFAFCAYSVSLSRSGPTVPFVPAAWNLWQPPHPCAAKSASPAWAPPCPAVWALGSGGMFPPPVWPGGDPVGAPPQPASRNASARNGSRRRIRASLLKPPGGLFASGEEPQAQGSEGPVAGHV